MRWSSYFIVCFISGLSVSVLASDKAACMVEGQVTVKGVTTDVKNCLQNNGMEPAQFKKICEGLKETNAKADSLGSSSTHVTDIDACPKEPKAICEGFYGAKINSYYYKQADPKRESRLPEICKAQGGKLK